MDSDDSSSSSPSDIEEATTNAAGSLLLPEKSKKRYEWTYICYKSWCKKKTITPKSTTEEILLTYFQEKLQTLKSPSSLWCEYSMLKTTLLINDNVDISSYPELKAFLKRRNVGYRPKKSKVFTREEIDRFLTEAPDDVYLLNKVVMIMAITGACRQDELVRLTVDDIEDKHDMVIITLPDTKKNVRRSFFIVDREKENVKWLETFRKYACLRPDTTHRRFFMRYQQGKCVNQVVGKNAFSLIPARIAKFLKLKDPKSYTGHAFRKTSAALLANTGSDILALRGGCNSSIKAESSSLEKKLDVADKIWVDTDTNVLADQTSDMESSVVSSVIDAETHSLESDSKEMPREMPVFNIINCTNCTFTFHINK